MSKGTAVIYQVGDRVKYKFGDCVDYGTVVKVDDSVYTKGGNVWALWDSNNGEQHSEPRCLTLIERKQVSEPKTKHSPHKYADVIKCWADGGEIQFKHTLKDEWITYANREELPYIGPHSSYSWRIKPEVKTLRYRTGLTKDNQIKIYTEQPMLDDAYGPDAFVKWIDNEWKTFSVEIE